MGIKKELSDGKFAFLLLFPGMFLIIMLIAYPMLSNIYISFFDRPINPNLDSEFIGLSNYIDTLTSSTFYKSLGITLLYTLFVVGGSTIAGLMIAIMFNRPFRFRKLSRSLIILSYVTPTISLVFAWRYMFNTNYGIINHMGVNILGVFDQAPLWFDNQVSSFILVVMFAIWRYFPYAFISFLAILQTISPSLYEAAEVDGANFWQKFKAITLPGIMPVLLTVVTLRTIWTFYIFDDVYLLTNQVNVLGVYLYRTAFAFNDLGAAAAISVILFIIIATLIIAVRKWVSANGGSRI